MCACVLGHRPNAKVLIETRFGGAGVEMRTMIAGIAYTELNEMATFVAAAAAIAVASTSAIAYAASWPTSWHTPVEFAVYYPHFPHIHTYCILYHESIGTKIMQKCGMFVFFSILHRP